MKLSWSHKIFLKINSHIGQRPRLDRFMYFCGFWLIWIDGALFFAVLTFVYTKNFHWGVTSLKVFLATTVLSYLMSYFVALLWPHARPVKELPQVKNLFKTLGNWKSFPSDHTIAVTIFSLIAFFASGSWIIGIIFFLLALFVAFGRVYGGVHYPRDIVGGGVVALLAFALVVIILYTQQ